MSSNGAVRSRKFNRVAKKRRALLRSLAIALISHGSIITTKSKAEALALTIRRMIPQMQSSSVHDKRRIRARLASRSIKDLDPSRIEGQAGQAITITAIGRRHGDNAEMVRVDLKMRPQNAIESKDTQKPPLKVTKTMKSRVLKASKPEAEPKGKG